LGYAHRLTGAHNIGKAEPGTGFTRHPQQLIRGGGGVAHSLTVHRRGRLTPQAALAASFEPQLPDAVSLDATSS